MWNTPKEDCAVVDQMDTTTELLCGRMFTTKELLEIKEIIRLFPKLSQNELAKTICETLDWLAPNGKYKLENEQWWTAGFWPGLLWKVYSQTNDDSLKITAEQCEEKMDRLLTNTECIDHDMGFMWTLTSLANYKLTGNKESRRRALLAANLLSARFNTEGNYIRAWNAWIGRKDNSGVAIIDCLMNLPLLYWASEETGDPRFKHIAKRHVNMVLEHFIREDGSVQHMVVFDSETYGAAGSTGKDIREAGNSHHRR